MRWMSEVQGGEGEEKGGKASQELYWSRFFSPPFRWGKKGLAFFLGKGGRRCVRTVYEKRLCCSVQQSRRRGKPGQFPLLYLLFRQKGKRLLLLRRRPLKMTILPILSPFSRHWRRFRPILLPPLPHPRPPTQPGAVRRKGKRERKEALFPEPSLCSVRWENSPKYNMSAVTNALLFRTCTVCVAKEFLLA